MICCQFLRTIYLGFGSKVGDLKQTTDCALNLSNVEASIRQTKNRAESSNLYTKYCHPLGLRSFFADVSIVRTALQGLWALHVETKTRTRNIVQVASTVTDTNLSS